MEQMARAGRTEMAGRADRQPLPEGREVVESVPAGSWESGEFVVPAGSVAGSSSVLAGGSVEGSVSGSVTA
jgi:hypothetical protein